jgi:hypothetical protein
MGIYLGQLPPAEIARFKAELAETIIANFCYPRFFDYRTESLQTRPIDRTKRQEVWLYLSSVDFTAWSRVDLTSADFPRHIERLFIQFVQRNRSFFGAQGRRRMLDIRLSIGVCAGSVSLRLRNHLTNQPNMPLFGSPRPVLSWTATPISGRPEPTWEQIKVSTMELQQQLQQWRGEIRTAGGVEEAVASASTSAQNSRSAPSESVISVPNPPSNGQTGRSSHPQSAPANPVNPLNPAASVNQPIVVNRQSTPPVTVNPSQPLAQPAQYSRSTPLPNPVAASAAPVAPNVGKTPVQNPSGPVPAHSVVPRRPSGNLGQPVEQNVSARQSGGALRSRIATSPTPAVSPAHFPFPPVPSVEPSPVPAPGPYGRPSSLPDAMALAPTGPHPAVRPVNGPGQRELFSIGEDDLAIFEQMRRQLVLWLRIEALSVGLELSGQEAPTQLLEMLRQLARYDETRLQIVSTLLNLATQVMKTGTVSVLDYKQALTFHLMHTKRP